MLPRAKNPQRLDAFCSELKSFEAASYVHNRVDISRIYSSYVDGLGLVMMCSFSIPKRTCWDWIEAIMKIQIFVPQITNCQSVIICRLKTYSSTELALVFAFVFCNIWFESINSSHAIFTNLQYFKLQPVSGSNMNHPLHSENASRTKSTKQLCVKQLLTAPHDLFCYVFCCYDFSLFGPLNW